MNMVLLNPEFVLELQMYSGQQIQIRKSYNYVIFRMKKCLLNVWEAMKGDAYMYMHFAMIQLIPLSNKL